MKINSEVIKNMTRSDKITIVLAALYVIAPDLMTGLPFDDIAAILIAYAKLRTSNASLSA